VSVLFLLNAMAYSTVVPRLPAIKADLGLSNTSLGTAVAAMPAGALVAGLAAGGLVARFGSGRVAVACAIGFGVVLPTFAAAPAWGVLAGTFAVIGALDAWMDVSMNAHALRVQRRYGRSIINALHGLWSVGAVAGAALGAGATALDLPLGVHLVVVGAAIAVTALVLSRWLLPGPDEVVEAASGSEGAPGSPLRRAGVLVALLGLLAIMSGIIEDAPSSWGAVFMRSELGTSATVAALVYVAFQVSMTTSRLLGDRVVDRFGEARTVRTGGLLTAVAVGAGLLVDRPWAVVAAFAVAGLGTAAIYPLVFHAAGNIPGVRPGHGVAVVAWIGRTGFLVGPPLVGLVGDAVSLRAGLLAVPLAGLAVAGLASVLTGPPASQRPPVTSTSAPAT